MAIWLWPLVLMLKQANKTVPSFPNAVLLEELSGNNKYQILPENDLISVLGLLPRSDDELVTIRKSESSVDFVETGFDDGDGDGLNALYENYHNLDDADDTGELGAYGDPDQDYLSNLEEFSSGTDPRNSDTDGDSWEDGIEVINGFDPLDPTDY